MTKYISKDTSRIILLFFSYKILLFIVLIFAIKFVPIVREEMFLGGGRVNYHILPELFSWANFDGEHYLSIAIFGYKKLEQAFFPVYPAIISFISHPFNKDYITALISTTIIGILISNSAFLIALLYLYDLIRIDFSKKIAFLTIILILIFPTSFYFGALYSESIFLLLSVLAFLNARKGNWFWASIFGMVASATRIFGIFLFPTFLLEAYLQKKYKGLVWISLIPLGLVLYMYYQYISVGDALAFYHLQPLVGEQRQSQLVFLPQVFFRYIKMLTSVSYMVPIYQTIFLEFITGIIFFILPIYGLFKKMRLSYVFYIFVAFVITTLQGSFSSVPRYVLVFFPGFIILAMWFNNRSILTKLLFFLCSVSLLVVETTLFLRGYWVA